MWYSEEKKYQYRNAGFQSGTGHFTQVKNNNNLLYEVGSSKANQFLGQLKSNIQKFKLKNAIKDVLKIKIIRLFTLLFHVRFRSHHRQNLYRLTVNGTRKEGEVFPTRFKGGGFVMMIDVLHQPFAVFCFCGITARHRFLLFCFETDSEVLFLYQYIHFNFKQ